MDDAVIALFRDLADRSAAEREEYFARHDVPEAIRREVESLLRFDVVSDSLREYVASAAENVILDGRGREATDSFIRNHRLPDAIGRFQVSRLLGRGGMGEVYLARDPVLHRTVAIKLISETFDDDAARRRLVREARAAARFRHPNIVTIFDAGEYQGRSYIAMEYVAGETLASLIGRRVALPLRRRLELIEEACRGLAHAHRAGVVHLDIKPDNLMVDDTGHLKVLDFGIARVLQGESIATAHVAGTLRYMSPEQLRGSTLDHRSDVFSLGCALFELVTYMPAYNGSAQEIVTRIAAGPVPRLLDLSPDIDHRLDEIVRRMMALEPADRYDDLDRLRVHLAAVRADIDSVPGGGRLSPAMGAVSAPVPHTPRGSSESRRSSSTRTLPSAPWRSRLVLAMAIAALCVVSAGAFYVWSLRTSPQPGSAETTPTPSAVTAEPGPVEPVNIASPKPEATGARDDVWRRLATGDREGVLALLRASADGGDSTKAPLPTDVLATVRATVLRARETATGSPGAAAASSFRSAEQELARASRLADSHRTIESLRALWQASDLYARSVADGRANVAPSSAATAALVEQPVVVVGRGAEATPVPKLESPPTQPSGLFAADTSIAPPAAIPKPEPPTATSDQDVINDVLGRYYEAYESLDVSAVLKAYPSFDRGQVEQLRRSFADLTDYEIEAQNTSVTLQNDMATVHTTLARRMVLRIGRTVANEAQTEFRLQRAGSTWVIVDVITR
jgi:serine/threonine protein kinase